MAEAASAQTPAGPPAPLAPELLAALGALRANVGRALLGKPEVVDLALIGLLAGGHVLLEDVPGVGKTLLARALAASIAADFRRVQFTNDLLPSDILGVAVLDAAAHTFTWRPGPIFTHVLLADEVNRATPRTQSALLEAMNDGQVTVDRTTHPLPRPFFVIATQNPNEFEGTYPLPESQLDRFLLRLRVGYPSAADEKAIVRAQAASDPLALLRPVLGVADVERLQAAVRSVRLEEPVLDYLLAICRATRQSRRLSVGVSPRGTLALARAAQARALLEGRAYVLPDDVKALAVPVLAHRVLLAAGDLDGGSEDRERVLTELVATIEIPV